MARGRQKLAQAIASRTRMAEENARRSTQLGEVVSTDPLEVRLFDDLYTVVEGDDLIIPQSVRQYDKDVGIEEGDNVIVSEASGNWVAAQVLSKSSVPEIGAPEGYAGLDEDGRLPSDQLPLHLTRDLAAGPHSSLVPIGNYFPNPSVELDLLGHYVIYGGGTFTRLTTDGFRPGPNGEKTCAKLIATPVGGAVGIGLGGDSSTSSALYRAPCRPNQMLSARVAVKVPVPDPDDTFYLLAHFYGAAYNSVATTYLYSLPGKQDGAWHDIVGFTLVPPDAAWVQLECWHITDQSSVEIRVTDVQIALDSLGIAPFVRGGVDGSEFVDPVTTNNDLPNPTFETNANGWQINAATGTAAVSTDWAKSGTKSLKCQGTLLGGGFGYVCTIDGSSVEKHSLTATGDKTYFGKASVKVVTPTDQGIRISTLFWNASDALVGQIPGQFIKGTGVFELSGQVRAPASATHRSFRVEVYGAAGQSFLFYVDDPLTTYQYVGKSTNPERSVPVPQFTKGTVLGVNDDATVHHAWSRERTYDEEAQEAVDIGLPSIRTGIPLLSDAAFMASGDINDLTWSIYDKIMDAFAAKGAKWHMILFGCPPSWRVTYGNPNSPPDASHFDRYAALAAAFAERYGTTRISAIELWNEPNLGLFPWGAAACTACLQQIYPAVKAVAPQLPVLMPGLAQPVLGGTLYTTFLQQMYDAGLKGYTDGINIHPYPVSPASSFQPLFVSEGIDRSINRARVVARANGDDSPLWITETGYSTTFGQPSPYLSNLTETDRANLYRYMWDWLAGMDDIGGFYVHCLIAPDGPGTIWYGYSLFGNQSFEITAAGRALAARARGVSDVLVGNHGSTHNPDGKDPLDATAWQARSERGSANGYATLDSAGRLPNSQLPTPLPVLNVVRDFGAVGDGVADDTAPVLATIAKAKAIGGATVFFPRGTYKLTAPLVMNYDHVNLVGEGQDASRLLWTADLGAGTYAVDYDVQNQNAVPKRSRFVRGLYIGGYDSGGTAPNSGSGVRWASNLMIEECWIEHWKYGIYVWGNHQTIFRSTVINCYYGAYYPDSLPAAGDAGDQMYLSTVVANHRVACVGIGNQTPISQFIDCHMGFSDYGILGETSALPLLQDTWFYQCNCESFGAAFIKSTNRELGTTRFRDQIASINSAFNHGTTVNAVIDLGTANIRNCTMDGFEFLAFTTRPPCFIAAGGIYGNEFRSMQQVMNTVDANNWPFAICTGGIEDSYVTWGNKRAILAKLSVACTRTLVLGAQSWSGADYTTQQLRPYQDGDPPVGVAVHDGPSGGCVLAQDRGMVLAYSGGNAIAALEPVSAGTTGRAKAAPPGGWGTSGILGIARAADDGTNVRLDLFPRPARALRKPSASVYHSTGQVIANNTLTTLTFDAERYDLDAMHSVASNTSRLVAVKAGLYEVKVHVAWPSNSTGYRRLLLLANIASVANYIAADSRNAASGIETDQVVTREWRFGAGDYVEAQVQQTSGGNLTIVGGIFSYSGEFTMRWVDE